MNRGLQCGVMQRVREEILFYVRERATLPFLFVDLCIFWNALKIELARSFLRTRSTKQ